jgi:hypothetical protein
VLGLCRWFYNAALKQPITAWQRRHASVTRFDQEAAFTRKKRRY